MFRILWQKKALILFLVVLLVLLPGAVSRPAQMLSKAVLTEITIDKAGGEYVLTGEMVINEAGGGIGGGGMGGGGEGEKRTKTLVATGASLGDAINKMSASQSKQVSFAHCNLMIMGEGLAGENLADLLRYFLHRTEINNNCAVAWKEKGRKTTLERFYKDYMRYVSTSTLTQGPVESAVFKSGKYAFTLDETQTTAVELLRSQKPKKRFVQDGEVLHVLSNRCNIKTSFKDDIPTVNIKLKIKTQLETNPQASTESLVQLARGLEQRLLDDVTQTLSHIYGQDADVLELYEKFYRKHNKRLSFYEFFNLIQFNVGVDVTVIT